MLLVLSIIIMFLAKCRVIELIYILNLLVFYLSILIVMPIEKSIANRYIKKAKMKIDSIQNLKIIAITGSFGKTSVKNNLYEMLSQKYNVCVTPASYNTPMGICKCILSDLKPFHEILILEFGAKRLGEIKYLCNAFDPSYAIITSIGSQHLESFKTIENIVNEKMELFEYITNKNNVVVNLSNKYISDYLEDHFCFDCSLVLDNSTFSTLTSKCVDYNNVAYFKNVNADTNGSSFEYVFFENEVKSCQNYSTKLLGVHNVTNVSLAICMAKKFGLGYGQICNALSNIEAVPHRLQLKVVGDYVLIDNAYNSNPTSFKCAIDTLLLFESARKIVITPGVIDQGDQGYVQNYGLGKYMSSRVDVVYVVNKTNRSSIVAGLLSGGFSENNLITCDKFSDIDFGVFKNGDVVLIENDLPDNYN